MAPNAYDKATSGYTNGPAPSGSPTAAAMHEQVRQGAKEQVWRRITDAHASFGGADACTACVGVHVGVTVSEAAR